MQETVALKVQEAAEKSTKFRWGVLAIIYFASMIAGADRANIGVVVPYIKESFHMTNTDIGAMTSLFFFGYAVFQVPVGALYSKYGVRQLYTLALVCTSLSTFFMGMGTSVFHLKVGRTLLGFSEAPLIIGAVTTINRWFPPQEKGLATGVFISSFKFAPAVVPPVTAYIIYAFGWQQVFFLFGIPGFFTAWLWWWLVKNNPKESRFCNTAETDYIQSVKSRDDAESQAARARKTASLKWLDKIIRTRKIQPLDTNRDILLSWSVWGCAIGYFCMVGITYTIMTWVPTYLVTVKKFSILKMGIVAASPWVGAILGNLIGGWLSDKVFDKRRKPVILLTAISTVVMMYSLLYAPNDPVILGAILLLAGILLNLGYSTFLVYPLGLATKEKSPFAVSIVNTAGSFGGAFAPFVVGMLLDNYNWDMVFTFLSVISFVTLIIMLTTIEPLEDYETEKA
ncbi:MAG: MFS transporter [Negativicutes bacterium]|nr:MFS transporter [Negativicutes bacterium]